MGLCNFIFVYDCCVWGGYHLRPAHVEWDLCYRQRYSLFWICEIDILLRCVSDKYGVYCQLGTLCHSTPPDPSANTSANPDTDTSANTGGLPVSVRGMWELLYVHKPDRDHHRRFRSTG